MADKDSKKHVNQSKCISEVVNRAPDEDNEMKKHKASKPNITAKTSSIIVSSNLGTETTVNTEKKQQTAGKNDNSIAIEETYIEKRFESLYKKITGVMESIDKNNISSSVLCPGFKNDPEIQRSFCREGAEIAATRKFMATHIALTKLPVREKKKLLDLYEERLIKFEKISYERAMAEILRKASETKDTVAEVEEQGKTKQEVRIKIRDDKELLKDVADSTTEKPKEYKNVNIREVCQNTLNLLKFQRTHTATYMHDIIPLLKAIDREYRSKQMSSISVHEILVLDQINYNIEFYREITNIEKRYKETLLDGHIFLSRHMTKLLESFLNHVYSANLDDSGDFMRLMEATIEKIYEIDVDFKNSSVNLEICEEVLELVKEILCTAYSIALVCDTYNSNVIKGSSKTVLEDLEAIKTTICTKNKSMCSLLLDSFCVDLCTLERKVNSVVLQLTVDIFASYEDKLSDLFIECNVNVNVKHRNTQEFAKSIDLYIANVDDEIDRIMQVGWFAISCSGYSKHSRNLRNALAKIEALEDEFVPGLITMKKRANETYMSAVLVRMLAAIKEVRKALYHTMDPHAFCMAVENQVDSKIMNFKLVKGKERSFYENLYKMVLRYFSMIKEMVDLTMATEEPLFQINQRKAIIEASENIKIVLKEIGARLEQAVLKKNVVNLEQKISKRCKVLRHEFKKLIKLVYFYEVENLEGLQEQENMSKIKDGTKIVIDYVEERAQKIIKNRSIIGNTPMKNKSLKVIKDNSKLDEKRKVVNTFSASNETHSSYDLDITAILDNISIKSKY